MQTAAALPGLMVFDTAEALAQAALARVLHATRGRAAATVCLSGGSTPLRLFRLLAAPETAAHIPWEHVHWYFGDERFVPLDDKRSNAGAARAALFDKVPAPASHIHAIDTSASDVRAAADAYDDLLQGLRLARADKPLFDLVLLGVGPDGHTASLFPGQAGAEDPHRLAIDVPRAGLEPFVPRISLTLRALASSHETLFLVEGSGKRDVIARLASGAELPAGRVQGPVRWMLDAAAASALEDAAD